MLVVLRFQTLLSLWRTLVKASLGLLVYPHSSRDILCYKGLPSWLQFFLNSLLQVTGHRLSEWLLAVWHWNRIGGRSGRPFPVFFWESARQADLIVVDIAVDYFPGCLEVPVLQSKYQDQYMLRSIKERHCRLKCRNCVWLAGSGSTISKSRRIMPISLS